MPVAEPNTFDSGILPKLNESLSIRARINQNTGALNINRVAIRIFAMVFTGDEPHGPEMFLVHSSFNLKSSTVNY
jgi:hypothetical protein